LVVPKETTTDRDVRAYRWLPIDLDPVRPAGISSSETELKGALQLRNEIAEEISRSYELPQPLKAISGNGGHLLYPLPDVPPKEYARALKLLLDEISLRFSSPAVTIDQAVHNPARIWKLYGTTARKGDEVPAGFNRETRLHRMAYIEDIPEWASQAASK
jgi:hypothetical protein